MPHTINLVSQFEDIIRRGGNQLESNLANAVRPTRLPRTGSKKKVTRRKSFHSESDESPPPIPKRAPITSNIKGHTDESEKVRYSENVGSFTDEYTQFDPADEKNAIFTIKSDDQVYVWNNVAITKFKFLNQMYVPEYTL